MKKIISLFQRNYDGDRKIRDEVVPGAEWVLAGEGIPTRKWDGTSCWWDGERLWKRYDAKHGKTPPPGFVPAQDPDPITGHHPGWVPVGDGPEDARHREALAQGLAQVGGVLQPWTMELCGPKVNGNPEGLDRHVLIPHGIDLLGTITPTFEAIRAFLEANPMEGIVWWRPEPGYDCDKVKIKSKDFGIPWPPRVSR